MVRNRRRWALLAAVVFFCAGAAPPTTKVIARIDLSKPFHLQPGASFTAPPGPDVTDPAYGEGLVPGRIHLFLRLGPSVAACSPNLDDSLKIDGARDEWSEIHDLEVAEILWPRGRSALP